MSLNIFPVLGQELNEDISDNSLSYEYSLELNNSYDKDSYQLLYIFNCSSNSNTSGNKTYYFFLFYLITCYIELIKEKNIPCYFNHYPKGLRA